jgi:hypothetical protein
MTLQLISIPRLWHNLIIYEPHSKMDEWFSNPKKHGILQNVIHVLTIHPWPSPIKGHKHHGNFFDLITSWVILDFFVVLKGGSHPYFDERMFVGIDSLASKTRPTSHLFSCRLDSLNMSI